MKAIEKFNGLSIALKVLVVVVALPVMVFIVGPLISIFTLPIIGYFIALNSWRANRRSRDRFMFVAFVVAFLLAIALFVTLRQPMLVTDWEGGNSLDTLIGFMMLALLGLVALIWGQLGWLVQRLVAQRKAQGRSES